MKALTILLVEDNEDHAELITDSLKEFNIANKIVHLSNGEQLIDYLDNHRNDDSPAPDLILLDLKMPRMDGKTALKIVKNDPRYKQIPVLIVTTSSHSSEIEECYKLGANSYITKPLQLDELNRKIKELNLYWVLTTELPQH